MQKVLKATQRRDKDDSNISRYRRLGTDMDCYASGSVGGKASVRTVHLRTAHLKLIGENLDLPVHTIPHEKGDFKQWKPPSPFYPTPSIPPSNHLLVTASFGRILPRSLLQLFHPSRRLNVHPSLLPKYRGPAPIQHAILNGEKETGVCVIEMLERAKGIDTGDIWGLKSVPIPENSTFLTLREKLAREGGDLLVSVLRDMLSKTVASIPQIVSPNTPTAPLVTASLCRPEFDKQTACELVRLDRAISHQKPITTLMFQSDRSVQLHKLFDVTPSIDSSEDFKLPETPGVARYDPSKKAVLVRCANGSVLGVSNLKSQDRKLVPAKEWWNGIPKEWKEMDGCVHFV
ncbi:hypothetical protein EW146_g2310 [Bondarzewia mesenterica]|uniref:methionyl-tRNA formyltransferase n=1 Tax=Bondarzewia mesenterica TaxID=1095465 RepID=A0A4S4M2Y9_9AGAM|nr:hypothetical protein EW146_g2310 [Bondarzewia mesenterica]